MCPCSLEPPHEAGINGFAVRHDFWRRHGGKFLGNVITLQNKNLLPPLLELPMKPSLLALSLAVALGTTAVHATDTTPNAPAAAAAATNGDDPTDGGSRNKQPVRVQDLGAVSVSAALDQARNALSPDTGSSQYVIDHKAIAQLPLGASTPMNQVLLQAPGVVQDS